MIQQEEFAALLRVQKPEKATGNILPEETKTRIAICDACPVDMKRLEGLILKHTQNIRRRYSLMNF